MIYEKGIYDHVLEHKGYQVLVPLGLNYSKGSTPLANLSNIQVFMKDFENCDGVEYRYSRETSLAVYLSEPALENKDIIECISTLYEYPVLDEKHYDNLLYGQYIREWIDYGFYDFTERLISKFELKFATREFLYNLEHKTRGKTILRFFYEDLIKSGNGKHLYTDENVGLYIPVERAVKLCSRTNLARFLKTNRLL